MHLEALPPKQAELFPKLKSISGFYLAGGTALALQIGHRVSVDFDLFSDQKISKALLSKVEAVFAGVEMQVLVNNMDELSVLASDVNLTFLHYPFAIVEPLVDLEGLSRLSTLELAATKAYTVGRRGSFKDYVDLYFVLKGGRFTLENIIEIAERKYGDKFSARLFLEQLLYTEDVEESPIRFFHEPVTLAELPDFFSSHIKKLRI